MIQDIATNAIGGLISGIAVMLVTTALSRKQGGRHKMKQISLTAQATIMSATML